MNNFLGWYFPYSEKAIPFAKTERWEQVYRWYGKCGSNARLTAREYKVHRSFVQRVVREMSLAAGLERERVITTNPASKAQKKKTSLMEGYQWQEKWLSKPTLRPPTDQYISFRG